MNSTMSENFEPWYVSETDWGVTLTAAGKFNGTIIQIQKLDFGDDNEVELKYHVVNKPEGVDESIYADTEFQYILQDIVTTLIKEVVKEHENRTGNFSESGQ